MRGSRNGEKGKREEKKRRKGGEEEEKGKYTFR